MRRREFITLLGCAAACPNPVCAQPSGHIRRIGVLLPGSRDSDYADYFPAFLKGLEDLGYVEHRDFVMEQRWADGRTERLPALARELVERRVDVLLVSSSLAANAALKSTTTIPIVQASGASPVGTGAARSLGRPQGNLTGFTNQSEDIAGKLLELLLLVIPDAKRIGVLMVPGAPVTEPQLKQVQEAAQSLGVGVHPVGVSDSAALERAFAELVREQVGGLVVFSAALIVSLSREIVNLTLTAKLPTIYPYPNFALHGGLMAYGIDHRRQFYRAANFVDRILNGAKPGDLPIEQPTNLNLVLNLKTANALGLTIPPTLLARADEVIE
jgi:putative ABC transport system substrate-binding protein